MVIFKETHIGRHLLAGLFAEGPGLLHSERGKARDRARAASHRLRFLERVDASATPR